MMIKEAGKLQGRFDDTLEGIMARRVEVKHGEEVQEPGKKGKEEWM